MCNPLIRSEIGLRDAVLPAKLIVIPKRPNEAQKAHTSGHQISKASPNHLRRGGYAAVKADPPQAAKHHAWRRTAENREEREILGVEKRKRSPRHPQINLVKADPSTQHCKERKHSPIAEHQQPCVHDRCSATLPERCHGIQRRKG